MAEIDDFEPNDADNTGRWPENMQFSAVNDAGRADEGIIARWWRDNNGSLAASGSSNAFTVTSNRTIEQLYDDLTLCFTANHTITGACTLNLNGIGAKAIKSPNGANLGSGAIVEGQPVHVVYKSGPDAWLMVSAPAHMLGYATTSVSGVVELATGAEVEAASDTTRPVTPGTLHEHPGVAKFYAYVTVSGGTPTLKKGYNVAGITDAGVGLLRVTIDNDFSSADWAPQLTVRHSPSSLSSLTVVSQSAGSVVVSYKVGTDDGAPTDPEAWSVAGYGELA